MSTDHAAKQSDKSHASNQDKPAKSTEQHPHAGKSERNVDTAVENTFPASDPPSIGGVTKIKPKETGHSGEKGSTSGSKGT